MQLDNELLFSDGQDLETAASTHKLDLLETGDDIGRRLMVFAKIDGGAVAGGDSMTAKWQTSADGDNWNDLVTYPTVTLTQMNATGWIVEPQPLPAGLQRYNRLSYTAALEGESAPFTGPGKVLAGITASVDKAL